MEIIGWMNGWMLAPHCWRSFLARPVALDQGPGWISITVLGFVVFLKREPGDSA